MQRFILILVLWHFFMPALAQSISGASGLLNIPSAEMNADGIVYMGGNFLPDAMTNEPFDYNTGNYYFNITFLPFAEFTYCSTLLKDEVTNNQDRAFGLRLRLLNESKHWLSVVAGGNDLYSSAGGIGSRYFNSFFVVGTKHLNYKGNTIGITAGYGTGGVRKQNLNGLFGGLQWTPPIDFPVKFMIEYDARVVSPGCEITVLKKLHLYYTLYEFRHSSGGIAYRIALNKAKVKNGS